MVINFPRNFYLNYEVNIANTKVTKRSILQSIVCDNGPNFYNIQRESRISTIRFVYKPDKEKNSQRLQNGPVEFLRYI